MGWRARIAAIIFCPHCSQPVLQAGTAAIFAFWLDRNANKLQTGDTLGARHASHLGATTFIRGANALAASNFFLNFNELQTSALLGRTTILYTRLWTGITALS